MKQGIHPKWNHAAVVTCACGSVFTTGSAQDTIQVDICSKCHPFFTGEMKFVDRQGRVDKFMQKIRKAETQKAALQAKKAAKADVVPEEVIETNGNEPLSYKQLLQNEQNKLKNVAQHKVN